ncbi:HEAT repeat domain-containing protein [Chlorogloeopsis sp. ULAP01]|uniref:HEAT repeat domain-containing protein n=1 Tax=Chlorogloeopsis sp. ULAP01 TaxID=3056483 RepID=UPI0025AA9DEB|nr:HEAT repeat domain-containing protein [Chlorogloeopsis sp. ULAP01]MDM9383310.1 HEAT repeat domain-containing protein [Chlorogloeopsis sp. ULAP01]
MNTFHQLLLEAQTAHDAGDWQLLIQCLQQLVLEKNLKNPQEVENREKLLSLALCVLAVGDFQQRWEIAKVFVNLGIIAIPSLVEILIDEEAEEELRWYAARVLGEYRHPEAIAALIELLKTEEDEELKTVATAALGQSGTLAINALTELLAQESTRLLAARSLSLIRHQETIAPLLSVVEDPQVAVRVVAIEALTSFHDLRVPPTLLKALDDVAASVRREAVLGLGFRPDLCGSLDLANKLKTKLYDFNLEVCCAAAIALSRIGGNDAAMYLFEVLISPNTPEKLQLEIIRALGWMENAKALEYLQTALNQLGAMTLWQEIVTVLGRVTNPQLTPIAAQILLTILQQRHPAVEIATVKKAIALSLGQLGKKEAVEPLIQFVADADALVRLHAIAALKNLAPETGRRKLQQLVNSAALTPDLQQAVFTALAEW